jgi:cardiolipin synthase
MDDPERGSESWRETGIEQCRLALARIEIGFADIWATMGGPMARDELARQEAIAPAGDLVVRVVATAPNTAGLFRLDQLIAFLAREHLWLTDAYYVGTSAYVQGAHPGRGGVDVRLFVSSKTDNPFLRPCSGAGYRRCWGPRCACSNGRDR